MSAVTKSDLIFKGGTPFLARITISLRKMRDNCLPQGNTAVITRYLMVSIYLVAVRLKQGEGFSEKQAVLENATAQGRLLQAGVRGDFPADL